MPVGHDALVPSAQAPFDLVVKRRRVVACLGFFARGGGRGVRGGGRAVGGPDVARRGLRRN
jgi:hypothetical protein